jgi:hypothetical protein
MKILCCNSLGWLCILCLCPICFAQTITIRVINIRNGDPLQKQQVSISIGYDKGEEAPAKYDKIVNLETDIEGKAEYNLPEPPPRYVHFRVRLSSEYWHYAPVSTERTQELIQQGVVVSTPQTKPRKSDFPIKVKPGEIIFLARPFTFFERLFYPVTKG